MDNRKWYNKYSTDVELKYPSEATKNNYKSCVSKFLEKFKHYREPKEIPTQEIKEYLLTFKTVNTLKHNLCAVKSFYVLTVGMPSKISKIPYPKKEKALPQIIDKDHLLESISKIPNIKHKAIIHLAFSTGMRVSEVCNLKIVDIDSTRMLIHIKNAKGNKDRFVKLSEGTLLLLREYFKEYHPIDYLFNGQFGGRYTHRSCNQIVKKYIGNGHHFHKIRHAHATALLENGTELNVIQKTLGHSNISSTLIYTHVSNNILSKIQTPC